jgi:hypothetical protein
MLRFAHLADAADPAVLIWGDATALGGLAALLREAAQNGRGMTLADPSQAPAVSLEITERGGGMTHVSGSQFRWSLRGQTVIGSPAWWKSCRPPRNPATTTSTTPRAAV